MPNADPKYTVQCAINIIKNILISFSGLGVQAHIATEGNSRQSQRSVLGKTKGKEVIH
jgi:hypothetical protein